MACPTCGSGMKNIGFMDEPYKGVPLFWCSRCGTLKANIITEKNVVPKLVSHVRRVLIGLGDNPTAAQLEECCRLPLDHAIGPEMIVVVESTRIPSLKNEQ